MASVQVRTPDMRHRPREHVGWQVYTPFEHKGRSAKTVIPAQFSPAQECPDVTACSSTEKEDDALEKPKLDRPRRPSRDPQGGVRPGSFPRIFGLPVLAYLVYRFGSFPRIFGQHLRINGLPDERIMLIPQ